VSTDLDRLKITLLSKTTNPSLLDKIQFNEPQKSMKENTPNL